MKELQAGGGGGGGGDGGNPIVPEYFPAVASQSNYQRIGSPVKKELSMQKRLRHGCNSAASKNRKSDYVMAVMSAASKIGMNLFR